MLADCNCDTFCVILTRGSPNVGDNEKGLAWRAPVATNDGPTAGRLFDCPKTKRPMGRSQGTFSGIHRFGPETD